MTSHFEDNVDAFTITSRNEIGFYLVQLINDAVPITVMFDEGRDSLLTMLLDVDDKNNAVIFDWGSSESVNRRLLQTQRAFFVANPNGVRNQFISSRIWETTYKKRPAFATRIPDKFVRMQRREFFRLALPISQRRPCKFTAGEANTTWEMTVVDIGIGGVALESPSESLPFEIGQIIPRVAVDLGEYGKVEVALEVRYVGTVSRGQKHATRLGCHFVKLSRAQENELQRFVTHVQCEMRALRG